MSGFPSKNHYNEYILLNQVRSGSSTILAADGYTGWIGALTAGNRTGISSFNSGTGDFDIVAYPTNGKQNRHPKGYVNTLMVDGSAGPRQWVYSLTDIPIPSATQGTDPSMFPPTVQTFWYGHTPNSSGR